MPEYFDLCLRTSEPETVEMVKKLGFSGVGILQDFESTIGGVKEVALVSPAGVDVALGIELKDMKRVEKSRKKELVVVTTGDLETSRKAVENPMVDILFCREMNYIMAKLAKKNNVSVGFNFSQLLHSFGARRSDVLGSYLKQARLVRKYKTPFVLTSGAKSKWDLRSPSDLISFGRVLGLENPEKGLTNNIVKENRKRLKKGWIMPGVEERT